MSNVVFSQRSEAAMSLEQRFAAVGGLHSATSASTTTPEPIAECSTLVIGQAVRREFSSLVKWLCRQRQIRFVSDFPDVDGALKDPDLLASADLTIVLQSWSDQYAAKAVDRLIGHTLNGRLLCCYGPWCESDGRNRTIWPDAARVPVRLAAAVIADELVRFAVSIPPLFPTSARDEVFAHRLEIPADSVPPRLDQFNAAVVSPDRSLRKTVAVTLRDLGIRTVSLPLIKVAHRQKIRAQETPRGPIHVVLHDLDPYIDAVRDSLEVARKMFPVAHLLGLATMPDSGLTVEVADEELAGIVPKLDMRHGLQWRLTELLVPD
ncbi:MAG: hypothetical protein R3C59_06470 [Planctomycetaceae bacterium]